MPMLVMQVLLVHVQVSQKMLQEVCQKMQEGPKASKTRVLEAQEEKRKKEGSKVVQERRARCYEETA